MLVIPVLRGWMETEIPGACYSAHKVDGTIGMRPEVVLWPLHAEHANRQVYPHMHARKCTRVHTHMKVGTFMDHPFILLVNDNPEP